MWSGLNFSSSKSFPTLFTESLPDPFKFPILKKKAHKTITELFDVPKLVSSRQVHGHRIAHLPEEVVGECDGLMTSATDLALLIQHADCQVALFFDPVHHAIANVHCGWRGNVQNIYRKTIGKMIEKFLTKPEDLLVCISPSLGPQRSEFRHYKRELPSDFYPFQIAPNYFDLWEISKMQLLREGILSSHLEIARMCTFEEADRFFSYRREKKPGGEWYSYCLKI